MSIKTVRVKMAIILGVSTLTILAFQNCSKVNFADDQDAAVFKAASTSVSSADDSLHDPGDDVATPPTGSVPGDDPVVVDNEDPAEVPPQEGQPPQGQDPGSSNEPNEPKDKGEHATNDEPRNDDKNHDSNNSLVECELISPNQKIILDQLLKKGSNASATRVCMSENACLKLINSYAAKRNCSLTLGASSLQDSEARCTKIFPGSKGTCRNAGVVSDEKVIEVLDLMGKS